MQDYFTSEDLRLVQLCLGQAQQGLREGDHELLQRNLKILSGVSWDAEMRVSREELQVMVASLGDTGAGLDEMLAGLGDTGAELDKLVEELSNEERELPW